jgi:mannosyltransferase
MTTTMRMPATRVRSRPAIATPLAVGAVALLVSLVAIANPSVWYDEVATISSATRSWSGLWAEIHTVDAVHVLYYAGMHLWFDLVGYSPFTLRLPSAVAIGIAAAFTVVLGRQLGRRSLGLVGGLVFALLPRTTWAGGEGRSYALTAAAAVILTVVLVHASRQNARRWWALYAAIAAASIALFVYLALVVLAHGIGVAVLRRRRLRWVVSAASAGLVASPVVLASAGQSGQISWLPRIDGTTAHAVLVEQWFLDSVPVAVVAWLLLAVGAITVWRSRVTDDRVAVLLPLVAVPTVVLLVATAAAFPVYTPRYLSMSLPFVALVIAAALDAAPWRPARVTALALVLALCVPALVAARQPESKEGAAWNSVAALIAAQKSPGSAIVYGTVQKHPTATSRVIAYAYPAAFAGTVDVTIATSAADSGRLWETTRPLAESLDRVADAPDVFLVTSKSRDLRPATTATLEADGFHVVDRWSLAKVNVVKYER